MKLKLKSKKTLIIAGVLFVFMLVFLAPVALPALCPTCGTSLAEGEVAKIGGQAITRDQLTAFVARMVDSQQASMPEGEQATELETLALDTLINETLFAQKAAEMGIDVTEEEVTARLDLIKNDNFGGDEQKFVQAIIDQNITMPEVRERVRQAMVAEKIRQTVINESADVTDEEIQKFYDENQSQLAQPESRHLRHILSNSVDSARAVKAQLDAGTKMEEVARTQSIDVYTKDNGGDLSWVPKGRSAPAFDQVAFTLPVGVWSDPVQTPSGWDLIRVDEIKPAGVPPLSEIRDEVQAEIVNQAGDDADRTWNQWLRDARQEAGLELARGYKQLEATDEALPPGHP